MRGMFVLATVFGLALSPQALASHTPHHGGQDHPHAATNGHGGARHHGGRPAGHWTAPAAAQAASNPVKATVASRQRGEALYEQNCAVCHGVAGRGDGPAAGSLPVPPANLFEMAPRHTDGDIAWKIVNGRNAMPAWEGVLETAQIWDLVNYLKNLPRAAAGSVDHHADGHTHD